MSKVSRRIGIPTRLLRGARFFVRDEHGAVAVILALMLAALLGIIALSFDLGRAWNTETELQNAADAGALAGVTQLDATDGARVRAIQAVISELANNSQRFAVDDVDADSDGTPDGSDVEFDTTTTINGSTGIAENRDIKFYRELPTAAANEATSDEEARYIEVNVFPREVDFTFAAMIGAVNSASPSGRAVAGWNTFYCDTPPMMMCNPAEPVEGDPDASFNLYEDCPPDPVDGSTSCVGRGIMMKEHTGGGHLYPGEWGFLSLEIYNPETGETETVTGASQLRDALASVEYNAICTGSEVTTRPGTVASIGPYLNMRFDMYPNDSFRTDPNRQPARNVGKGLLYKDPMYDPSKQCRFNTTSPSDTGSSDWVLPNGTTKAEDSTGPGYQRYKGPGWHEVVDVDGTPGPDPHPNDPDMGTVQLVGGDPSNDIIAAMSYPRDACAYTAVNSNEANFDPDGDGTPESIKGGVAGCVFVPPPGDTTTPEGDQIGSGQWDAQTYLDVYHPGVTVSMLLDPSNPDHYADLPNIAGDASTRDGKLSRWEVYSWEKKVLVGMEPGTFYPFLPQNSSLKSHRPQCYKGPQTFEADYDLPEAPADGGTVDRRIIVMAVVNCISVPGGGRRTVARTKPHGNIAVFMTEAMGEYRPDAIYGELIDPRGLGISEVAEDLELVHERILLIE